MKHDCIGHPKFKMLEKMLGIESYQAAGILTTLWSYCMHCAQDGKLKHTPQEIHTLYGWPKQPDEVFSSLVKCGWIDEYDGYMCVHDWNDHKPEFLKKRDIRTTGSVKTNPVLSRHVQTNPDMSRQIQTCPEMSRITKPNLTKEDSLIPVSQSMSDIDSNDLPTDCSTTVERPVGSRPKLSNGHQKSFDAFWAAWPRKAGKGAAEAWWIRNKPDAETVSAIMAAIELQRHCDQWTRDGGQFIPHPTTWLNQKRWLDEPTVTGDTYHDTVTGDVAAREAEFEAWMDRVDVQR